VGGGGNAIIMLKILGTTIQTVVTRAAKYSQVVCLTLCCRAQFILKLSVQTYMYRYVVVVCIVNHLNVFPKILSCERSY
jgi:hypothetical protein